MHEKEIRFIEMFAGIGGFRLGLEEASKERDKESRSNSSDSYREQGTQGRGKSPFNSVWYNDIDRWAVKSYNAIFSESSEAKDIREVDPKDIPEFDMLTAGFPCQSFSIAGKRKGFADIRGTLFFEICRIAEYHRPRLLLLENVKGIFSHEGNRTFATVIASLDKLGYDVEWLCINSKGFVPQNRERVFIVGHLRNGGSGKIFPILQDNKEADELQGELSKAITARYGMSQSRGDIAESKQLREAELMQLNQGMPQGYRVYDPEGISSTITSQAGGLGAKTGLYAVPVLTPMREKRQQGRRFKENGEPAFTVNTQDRHGIFDGMRIRKLTPRECWRLQGFPDWAFDRASKVCSDSQLYKQAGNAVTVDVIRFLGKRISG